MLGDTNDSLQGVSNRIPEDKFITIYLIKSSTGNSKWLAHRANRAGVFPYAPAFRVKTPQ